MKVSKLLVCAAALVVVGHAEAAPKAKSAPAAHHDVFETPRPRIGRGAHNMAGCGLGSIVIQDQTKWSQVGAAFLNGTGVQTSGITFGTSNCTEDGVAQASREKDAFVEANLADLRRDVTVGSGSYLSSLASLYGCKGEAVQGFGAALQKHQDVIMNSQPESASGVIDSAVKAEKVSCQG